jgi:hypothetical protein
LNLYFARFQLREVRDRSEWPVGEHSQPSEQVSNDQRSGSPTHLPRRIPHPQSRQTSDRPDNNPPSLKDANDLQSSKRTDASSPSSKHKPFIFFFLLPTFSEAKRRSKAHHASSRYSFHPLACNLGPRDRGQGFVDPRPRAVGDPERQCNRGGRCIRPALSPRRHHRYLPHGDAGSQHHHRSRMHPPQGRTRDEPHAHDCRRRPPPDHSVVVSGGRGRELSGRDPRVQRQRGWRDPTEARRHH